MATNFPGSIDNVTTLPYPTAVSPRNGPSLAGLNDNQNDAIIATQTKVGTGASTPTNNNFLVGTGTGTSAWTKAVPTGVVVGTTDSQTLTNKILTSPTINSPVITNANITTDTVTGFTVSNTGTIFGVPVTTGVIQTASTVSGAALVAASVQTAAIAASAITTAKINNQAVTADKLGLSPATSYVVTDESTTSVTYADLATVQSVTITVGADGMALVLWSMGIYNGTGAMRSSVAVSGASTVAANDNWSMRSDVATFQNIGGVSHLFTGLTPGSNTFTLKFKTSAGTGRFFERSIIATPL